MDIISKYNEFAQKIRVIQNFRKAAAIKEANYIKEASTLMNLTTDQTSEILNDSNKLMLLKLKLVNL